MPSNTLNANYWEQRYQAADTPWDAGAVTPPLQQFFDLLPNKAARILIPGAGHGHEAIYLHDLGFQQVRVCDWSESALHLIADRRPDFPSNHLLAEDFFELEGPYDYIVEQTFFCAIDRSKRKDYAKKCSELLVPGGILIGLLWADEYFEHGPPFGGRKEEYLSLFRQEFAILSMDITHLSIPPRAGRELLMVCQKVPIHEN